MLWNFIQVNARSGFATNEKSLTVLAPANSTANRLESGALSLDKSLSRSRRGGNQTCRSHPQDRTNNPAMWVGIGSHVPHRLKLRPLTYGKVSGYRTKQWVANQEHKRDGTRSRESARPQAPTIFTTLRREAVAGVEPTQAAGVPVFNP